MIEKGFTLKSSELSIKDRFKNLIGRLPLNALKGLGAAELENKKTHSLLKNLRKETWESEPTAGKEPLLG